MLPTQIHGPGISITSNAGPPLTHLNPEVASARWRAAPLRAGSIDARGAGGSPYDAVPLPPIVSSQYQVLPFAVARPRWFCSAAAASTDAQIGSFAVGGREAAAADDAAATQAVSGGRSEDSQAGTLLRLCACEPRSTASSIIVRHS